MGEWLHGFQIVLLGASEEGASPIGPALGTPTAQGSSALWAGFQGGFPLTKASSHYKLENHS